jgi:serine/threonine-protein kinase RsbW
VELFKRKKISEERLLKQFRLQVQTDIEDLARVLQWFEQATKYLLPDKCRWQCQLALSEGFTNAVRYAHEGLVPTTPIDLEINVFASELEIRIWDWGKPFDLHAKLKLLRQENENPLDKEGDRGLFFMQELTDDLQYLRLLNRRNCLILRKKIPC